MAKVKAPFLSLGASGKLAGTLVASTWKGIKTMREYVIPANPRTAAQTTQRNLFAYCVLAFRSFLANATLRGAWDRTALASGKPQSGFNSAMRALLGILGSDPDASFTVSAEALTGDAVEFVMKDMDDGGSGSEGGIFELWQGTSATSLLLIDDVLTIAGGVVQTGSLGSTGDVVFVKLRKSSFDRSGIFKITLIA